MDTHDISRQPGKAREAFSAMPPFAESILNIIELLFGESAD